MFNCDVINYAFSRNYYKTEQKTPAAKWFFNRKKMSATVAHDGHF